ncbi:phage tail protein [Vibrio fluvialis]|nr:phage tail protein [Vibrio fluvialis]
MNTLNLDSQIKSAIHRLSAVSKRAVPVATARAINKMSTMAERQTAKDVAKSENMPQKLVRQRIAAIKKSNARDLRRRVRLRRSDVPAVQLGKVRQTRRGVSVRQRRFNGAFLADGSKGFGKYRPARHRQGGRAYQDTSLRSQQVLQRTGKGRYPLQVVTVSIEKPITEQFERNVTQAYARNLGPELALQLGRELNKISRNLT